MPHLFSITQCVSIILGRCGSVPTFLIAIATYFSRFGLLAPNVSPLGSFGFFSQNAVLFFAQIILFDVVRGGFYDGYYFTYLGFACYYFIGKLCATSTKKQLVGLPLASFLFFLISNFGVWLYWYPTQNWQTLLQCYILALPFYQRTILGDLAFGYGFVAWRHRAQIMPLLKKAKYSWQERICTSVLPRF